MTQEERDSIGMELSRAAIFYDRSDFDKTKISMMIDILFDAFPEATSSQIIKAIKSYRDDQKNLTFPAPARLAAYLRPSISKESQASEITSRIIESITKFGYTSSGYHKAKEHIGNIGWIVVQRFGGWQPLCEDLGLKIPLTTFQAQAREIIKAQLEIQNSGVIDMTHLLNGPKVESKQLAAPVKFSEEETKDIARVTQGQPREMVEQFIESLAKKKAMKDGEGA